MHHWYFSIVLSYDVPKGSTHLAPYKPHPIFHVIRIRQGAKLNSKMEELSQPVTLNIIEPQIYSNSDSNAVKIIFGQCALCVLCIKIALTTGDIFGKEIRCRSEKCINIPGHSGVY